MVVDAILKPVGSLMTVPRFLWAKRGCSCGSVHTHRDRALVFSVHVYGRWGNRRLQTLSGRAGTDLSFRRPS